MIQKDLKKNIAFLQNIQDTKYNSFKIMKVRDHLQRITNPFQFNTTQNTNTTNAPEEDISDEEENFLEGEQLDTLMNSFSTEIANNITANNNIPQKLNLEYIKSKGSHKCGFKDIASIDPNNDNVNFNLVQNSNNQQLLITNAVSQSSHQNQGHTHNDIVSILLTKKSKRYRSFETNSKEKIIKTYEANGSVYSIINWARQAKLDNEQKEHLK